MSRFHVGRSPEKERVRTLAYSKVSPKGWRDGYHIVIASRECGDIKYLLSMGVSPQKIVACDIDPIARKNARKLGVVISASPDIVQTVRLMLVYAGRENIASINVDLCGQVHMVSQILTEIFEAALPFGGIHQDTQVFTTYSRNRNKDGINGAKKQEYYSKLFKTMNHLYRRGKPVAFDNYQSWTVQGGSGTPMCMAIL